MLCLAPRLSSPSWGYPGQPHSPDNPRSSFPGSGNVRETGKHTISCPSRGAFESCQATTSMCGPSSGVVPSVVGLKSSAGSGKLGKSVEKPSSDGGSLLSLERETCVRGRSHERCDKRVGPRRFENTQVQSFVDYKSALSSAFNPSSRTLTTSPRTHCRSSPSTLQLQPSTLQPQPQPSTLQLRSFNLPTSSANYQYDESLH